MELQVQQHSKVGKNDTELEEIGKWVKIDALLIKG